jgi:thiamine biosynthesis lipoprotein
VDVTAPTGVAEPEEFLFRHQPLLGTLVEVRIRAAHARSPEEIDAVIVGEISRLESVFSAYDDDSELNRWKRDELDEPSPELVDVMAAASRWQDRSDGAFNPMSGVLTALWQRAAVAGAPPAADELAAAAAAIAEPRFEVVDGILDRIGDCAALNLNAIAKGFIVDRAVDAAVDRFAPSMVVVSAGGDLRHSGEPPARIGIENPLRPYDNEPPLAVIELSDGGLATSGGARRGVRIGGDWFSHVIDPRSGEPVRAQASISVVAADAMTADVMATVLGLSNPQDAVDLAGSFDDVGCLVVGPDGTRWTDPTWRSRFGPATGLLTVG